jgi:hypothetical protein
VVKAHKLMEIHYLLRIWHTNILMVKNSIIYYIICWKLQLYIYIYTIIWIIVSHPHMHYSLFYLLSVLEFIVSCLGRCLSLRSTSTTLFRFCSCCLNMVDCFSFYFNIWMNKILLKNKQNEHGCSRPKTNKRTRNNYLLKTNVWGTDKFLIYIYIYI